MERVNDGAPALCDGKYDLSRCLGSSAGEAGVEQVRMLAAA